MLGESLHGKSKFQEQWNRLGVSTTSPTGPRECWIVARYHDQLARTEGEHPVPQRRSQPCKSGKETQGQELTGRCSSSMKAGAAAVKDASASKPPSAVAEAVSRLAWVESVCKIKCSN